ncbi:MAG: alpha/beta hydrolase [Treponema sp.]|jgi:acetyl esterase/lipase|nr:alpha/beta hydrolase [Treponema sp.]
MKYKINALLIALIFCLAASCSNPNQDTSGDTFWTFKNASYGTDRNQTFNMIVPEGKDNVHAIVYIHGGFYYSGNKLWYPLFLKDYADNNIFATIDYRLISPIGKNIIHMDDMLEDVDKALQKIKELAGEKDCNITDFILVGHSAGAHISLLYGYTYLQEHTGIEIAACVSLAGPTDYTDDDGWSSMTYYGEMEKRLETLSWLGTELIGHEIKLTQADWTNQDNWSEYAAYARKISPITYVSGPAEIPPTLLVHGRNDVIVPYSNSERLNAELGKTSIPHKLITVESPGGNNHMLGGEPNLTDSIEPIEYEEQEWVDEAKKWMETYLR